MLSFILRHYILFIVLTVISFLIAAGSAMLEAWTEFREKPKEEMFWCSKHGHFRKKHCLPLFPHLGNNIQNAFICPLCYKAEVFDKPNMRLKEN